MARDKHARPTKSGPKRQRGGIGWLIIALVIGGILAAVIFAPEQLRDGLGLSQEPSSLGSAPSESRSADGDTTARTTTDLEPRAIGSGVETAAADPELAAVPTVSAPVVPTGPADAERGRKILAAAEEAYRGFNWDGARAEVARISGLDVDPATRVRAEDILRGADALEDIFEKLNLRDELVRTWDTHPALVIVSSKGVETPMVPVVDSMAKEKTVPQAADHAAWLRSQLASRGEAHVVLTSGAGTILKSSDVQNVLPADLASVIRERQETFDGLIDRLERGAMKNDALAWYEAAKYAYRNRLDQKVTTMLDRAIELNPFLADAIREDKANDIFFKMTLLLEKNNRAGASVWKSQLDKYYQGTSVYDQAVAYYDGNLEKLAMAQKRADEQRRAAKQKAHEARIERAEKLQDKQILAKIREERPVVDETPAAPIPASGDAGEANTAMATGMDLLGKAQNMPVSDARDAMYTKAQGYFDIAKAIYEKLGMADKMVQANQYRYACIKCRRSF